MRRGGEARDLDADREQKKRRGEGEEGRMAPYLLLGLAAQTIPDGKCGGGARGRVEEDREMAKTWIF